jgi:hypothetical protein
MAGHELSLVLKHSVRQTADAPRFPDAVSLPLSVAFDTTRGALDEGIASCLDPDEVTGTKESNPCALFSVT